jgi:hypothetical protein
MSRGTVSDVEDGGDDGVDGGAGTKGNLVGKEERKGKTFLRLC